MLPERWHQCLEILQNKQKQRSGMGKLIKLGHFVPECGVMSKKASAATRKRISFTRFNYSRHEYNKPAASLEKHLPQHPRIARPKSALSLQSVCLF